MGGCGAITFCGEMRFQLIASKRFDGTGRFGFTLIRKHVRSSDEERRYKKPWYEYLKVDDEIPSFDVDELDLGLYQRKFRTGSIIKLYSYDVDGNKFFRMHMSRSINEFLFAPVLPMTIKESAERYPNDERVSRADTLFGLKRELEDSEYVETKFPEEILDRKIGTVKITVYVFKVRAKGKNLKETKRAFRGEYFKNNMSVIFSLNGQVHGHYTSEFISLTLKFNLIKDYVLIHVDCTDMNSEFRDELTMPSRDRFKNSKQMKFLRRKLGQTLGSGRLRDIYKARKDQIGYDSTQNEDLLKQIAEELPLDNSIRELIKQTLELDKPGGIPKPKPPKPPQPPVPLDLKRFPPFFRVKAALKDGLPILSVPIGGSRSVQFESDVEDDYFDRTNSPGGLDIALLTYIPNDSNGGDRPGTVNSVSDVLSINKKSPKDGNIRVVFEPTEEIQVGDEIELRVDLHSSANPNDVPPVVFWISIIEQNKPPKPKPPQKDEKLGLPLPILVKAKIEDGADHKTWEDVRASGVEMDYSTVMYPFVEGEKLEAIYINMDSHVLKDFKSKKRNPSEEQHELADRHYISRVYYHTLFLYVISKHRKYAVRQFER